ncbi:hypothetical protein F4678DRAFT_2631 [Xylaria arbuscula]|nr:hypothetical protein F4678DRAFT_2631 [Xylaria arbuscula]
MAAQAPASALALASAAFLERPEASSRISAPYGQACINCAKAKCKCIVLRHGGSGSGLDSRPTCERCARLGRECKPSSGVRKRGAGGSRRALGGSPSAGVSSGTSAATRAANLEQKLEDLVAILKAQTSSTGSPQLDVNGPHGQGRADQNTSKEPGLVTPSVTDWRLNNVSSRVVSGGPTVVTPATTSCATCSTADSTPSPLPAADAPISAAQAEETLAFFRQHYLKFFPFVYLSPETTAAQLQRDRPYLWLNITALCCKSPLKQMALGFQSREELALKVLVACERNIDLLLGVLCYLGWTMHLCFKPGLAATMGLACSMVSDLRLDQPTHEDSRMMKCFKPPEGVKHIKYSTVRTMEERRAVLACYVSCACGSTFLKCASMRWTPNMDDSLKVLASNPEWEGDLLLVLMVRLGRLAEKVSQAQSTWLSDCEVPGASRPPVNMYIKYFQQCLQRIKDEVPESMKDDRLVTSLVMNAEMLIAELSFSNWSHTPESGIPFHARCTEISRVEASYVTLQTSKAFLEHFLTFEVRDFVGFSFPVLLNFFRAAHILYRLRILDDPVWDRSAVTNSVDIFAAMDLAASRFSQLPALYGFLTETDADGNEVTNFYLKCAKTFNGTGPMWRAHFAQADAPKAGADATVSTDAGAGETVSHVPPAMMSDGLTPNFAGRGTQPGMSNFILPELFPMDFTLDDVWSSEIMGGYPEGVFGLPF